MTFLLGMLFGLIIGVIVGAFIAYDSIDEQQGGVA